MLQIYLFLAFFFSATVAICQDTSSVIKDGREYPNEPSKNYRDISEADDLRSTSEILRQRKLKRDTERIIRAERIRLGKEKFDEAITPADLEIYHWSKKTGRGLTILGAVVAATGIGVMLTGAVMSKDWSGYKYGSYIGAGAIISSSSIALLLPGIVTWKRANYRIKKCREL